MIQVSIDKQVFSIVPQEVVRINRPAIVEHEAPLTNDAPVEYMGKHQTQLRLNGFVQTPQFTDSNTFLNNIEALSGSHSLVKIETSTKGIYFVNDIYLIEHSEARIPPEYRYDKFYYQLMARRSRITTLGQTIGYAPFTATELVAYATKVTGNTVKAQIGAFALQTQNSLGNTGGFWKINFAFYTHDSVNNRPGNTIMTGEFTSPHNESYGPTISMPTTATTVIQINPADFYWIAFVYQRFGTGSLMQPLYAPNGLHKTATMSDLVTWPNPWTSTTGGTQAFLAQAWMGI